MMLSPVDRAALRTAIGVVIAAFIALSFHLDQPYWACISVLVVMNPYSGAVKSKGILRIIATITFGILGYFIAGLVINSFILFILTCIIIISLGFYFSACSAYPYIFILGCITFFLVIGEAAISVEAPFHIMIWRSTEIIIGVSVAWVMTELFFPVSAEQQLRKLSIQYFQKTNYCFKEFVAGNNISSLVAQLKQILTAMQKLQEPLKNEQKSSFLDSKNREQFFEAFDKIQNLIFDLNNNLKNINLAVRNFINKMPLENFFLTLDEFILHLEKLFSEENKGVESKSSEIKYAAVKLQDEFHKLRNKQILSNLNVEDIRLIHSLMLRFTNLCDIFIDIDNLFLFSKNLSIKATGNQWQKIFSPKTDAATIKYSIKAGLSVGLALIGWLLSQWPGGLQGIVSASVISIQKNIYDIRNVSFLRFLGCLIGASIAFLCLNFFIYNTFLLLLTLFITTLAAAKIMFSNTRYAYAGLQANFAIIIVLVESSSIATSIAPALERLSGIILGIFATAIINHLLWPENPELELYKKIQENYNILFKAINRFYSSALIVDTEFDTFKKNIKECLNRAEMIINSVELYRIYTKKNMLVNKQHILWQKEIATILLSLNNSIDINNAKKCLNLFNINLHDIQDDIIERINLQKKAHQQKEYINLGINSTKAVADEKIILSIRHNPIRIRIKHHLMNRFISYLNSAMSL